jgi:AcrR family transcriptional regulator
MRPSSQKQLSLVVLLIFKQAFNITVMQRARGRRGRQRSVGRPSAQADADIRAALVATAKELFLKHGFEKVTARQIAAAAGTTPAMIHYYFENKVGLFRAMLQQAIEPFDRMLSAAIDEHSDLPPTNLALLIAGHLRTVAANSWLAPLIVNEVLPEHGKFRAAFVRDIAGKLLPMLVQVLEDGRKSGKLRRDIDPKLTALSIVSLNMFPFISRPITSPQLGYTLEGEGLDRLIAHTTRLLLEGIGPDDRGEKR